MNKHTLIIGITITLLTLQGCGDNAEQSAQPTNTNTAHTGTPSNRVAIPPAVRSNLGITFATVERRQIQDTLRVPGRFEYMPTAKREYGTMLAGRVEILVDQFDHVEKGTALYRIDSPAWQDISRNPVDYSNSDWWKEITTIEVNALQTGVVESIDVNNGAWVDEQMNVLTIVQTDQLRFHAAGLQSDLGILRDGLAATIVPPTPTASDRSIQLQDTMHGTLSLGLSGDANKRTIDLYVSPSDLASWARPGISAQLEIVIDSTRAFELAIPLAAVQKDGLTPLIFRRNPDNLNEAIRMEADLGLDDGRWVAILSGVTDGDEVVLDGGFQLTLATSSSIQQGGHFHADGTFHEGAH